MPDPPVNTEGSFYVSNTHKVRSPRSQVTLMGLCPIKCRPLEILAISALSPTKKCSLVKDTDRTMLNHLQQWACPLSNGEACTS